MEGRKYRVGADARREPCPGPGGAAPGFQGQQVAVGQAVARRRGGVDFGQRFGGHGRQLRDPAGLRARLVLGQDAPGGQVQGVFLVGFLRRRAVQHRVEPGLAAGRGEGLGEQPGRAGVVCGAVPSTVLRAVPGAIQCRAGPEDALVGFYLRVGDAGVVGDAAGAGGPQFLKDRFRVGVGEPAFLAQPGRQPLHQFQVGQDFGGRVKGAVAADDPAFQVGHGALFLGPLRGGQHHVGQLRRFRQEEVGDGQEVQGLQARPHVVAVGGGDGHVGAEHQQGADAALGAQGVQQFVGGLAGAGQFVLRVVPHPGDVLAGGGVGDEAVAGELVGLLAVLAAALAVALAGQAAVAGAGAAHRAQGQGQVDAGQDVVDALGLLFGAPAGEDHGGLGAAQDAGGLEQFRFGDAGDAFHPFGPVGGGDLAHPVEALGARCDVGLVNQVVAD